MKFNLFTLACIAAVSQARSRRDEGSSAERESTKNFLNWAAQNGVSYSGTEEFARREQIWLKTD